MSSPISFSITVPIGSYHPFLESCLASLCIQSVPLEVAVLDASGDQRVVDIVDKFAEKITYRYHGPDDGQADAIAKGWEATRGTVLGWLNADDLMAPDALQHAADFLRVRGDVDVVYGHSLICDDDQNITGYHWNVMSPGDQILSTCCISQPSCFFRREALMAAGGLDRSLHYTMDWDLWIKLYKSGAKFHLLDKIRSQVLWTEEAKTGGFGKQRRAELKRLLDANPNPGARLNGYLGFASHFLYEYVLPRDLRNWIWRRNISGGRGMFGINVSGDIQEQAEFDLFHYEAEPKHRLLVCTDVAPDSLEVAVNGLIMPSCELDSDGLSFKLSRPVCIGKTAKITLRNRAELPLHISGIRLD